jgi:hypothetical protein
MARSDTSGAVDADIQIALAVLLNTNEVRSAGGLNALGGSCSFSVGL